MRPEVGTQAQFKKKKPPKTYRYDSLLSPALDWDAKRPVREERERLIKQVLDAKTLEEAKAAVTKGYDPLEDVKRAAAERWVAAVNADGAYGQ